MRWQNWLVLVLVPLLGSAANWASGQGPAEAKPIYQGKNLEEWLEALQDTQAENRTVAAQSLAVFGPQEKVVAALAKSLKDGDDYTVVRAAAETLGKFGPKARKALPVLRTVYQTLSETGISLESRTQARQAVADALILIDDHPGPELAPILLGILKIEDAEKRRQIVTRLGKLGPDAAKTTVPALIQALTDKDNGVRLEAAKALGLLGPAARPALHALTLALKKAAPEKTAVAGTASLETVGRVTFTVVTGDKDMLKVCAEALGRIRPETKGTAAALRLALRDLDDGVRWAALCALLETGQNTKEIVPILVPFLRDQDASLRRVTVEALGKSGSPAKQILPHLTAALKDANVSVRETAVKALGERVAEAKPAAPAMLPLLKDKEAKVRSAAVAALGKIGLPEQELVPVLVGALADKESDIVSAAMKPLIKLGPRASSAIPRLLDLLKDGNEEQRVSVSLVLGSMGRAGKDAVATLEKTSKDDSSGSARLMAHAALAKIDPSRLKATLPQLTAALKTKDEKRLEVALLGLLLLGRDALPSLRAVREHIADAEVRDGVDQVIEAIQDPKKSPFGELWP